MIKIALGVFVGGLAVAAITQVPTLYKEHKQKERERTEQAKLKQECRANPDHYYHYVLGPGVEFVSADKYDRFWSNYGVPCRETAWLKYNF